MEPSLQLVPFRSILAPKMVGWSNWGLEAGSGHEVMSDLSIGANFHPELSPNSFTGGAHGRCKCFKWICIMFAGWKICQMHRRPQSHNLWAFLTVTCDCRQKRPVLVKRTKTKKRKHRLLVAGLEAGLAEVRKHRQQRKRKLLVILAN